MDSASASSDAACARWPTAASPGWKSPTQSTRPAAAAASTSAPGPSPAPPRADYDAPAPQAVRAPLLRDRLNVEQTKAAMRRDFLVALSDGFVYDCLRWQLARLDLAEHR